MKSKLRTVGKWAFIVTGTIAILLWVVAFGLLFTQDDEAVENEAHKVVRAVCVDAYDKIDGGSEQACAIAQEVSQSEFICTPGVCWVQPASAPQVAPSVQ